MATGARSGVWLIGGDRVLKVLDPPVDPGRAVAEAEALHRARGDHVVELLDVSGDDDEWGLVFPRLGRGSLAVVLAARDRLDAGEAVTALVPVAGALARMHAAGVAHGALGADAILFAADGAPVLTGFGSAVLFEPGLPEVRRERIEAVAADRAALTSLARSVLLRVGGPRSGPARELADRLRDEPSVEPESRLVRELFELAAARPVVLDAPPREPPGASRSIAVDDTAEPVEDPAARPLPAMLARVLESGPGELVRRELRRRWSGLAPSRRRAVLGAGAAVLAMLMLIAVIPGAESSPVPAPERTEDALPEQAPIVDDPIEALAALLDRRAACLRELSLLCLTEVDQDGSAAATQDRTWLQDVLDGGITPPVISAAGATITERLGDSVLVALAPGSDPASVLLMRTEAGWRIRDYLAATPGE